MKKICAVILASGVSRRLGFNKLTLRIDGVPVIRRSVMPFLTPEVEKVYVVTSMEIWRMREALGEESNVEIVPNGHYREGMSSSVKAALPFIEGADAAFFHLGDKPFLRKEQVRSMCALYLTGGSDLIIPRHEGSKGHPVLMRIAPYLDEMRRLEGDKGLREVVEKHVADVVFLEGDEGNIFDIDTLEDIEQLKRRGHKVEKG